MVLLSPGRRRQHGGDLTQGERRGLTPRARAVARREPMATGQSGGDLSSGVEARLDPRCRRVGATELDAIVQAKRPVLPELDDPRDDAKARPMRWARHGADG